jgi:hypothetical protein
VKNAFEKEDEMKKLLVVMLVLSMASMANAALYISVDGVENPPESAITLMPSQSVIIDITGDGQTLAPIDVYLFASPMGGATMTGGVMLYTGSLATFMQFNGVDEAHVAMLRGLGYNINQTYYMNFASAPPVPPLSGKLVDEIVFHCDAAPGDVLLTLMNYSEYEDEDGNIIPVITLLDTQIIHQIIPEPMTLGLLGLGGLFLRRRR